MIEAWFSSSLQISGTAPPGAAAATAVTTPRLAAYPVGNSTARSVPFQSASSASSSAWTGRLPTTRREAPEPLPPWRVASTAASMTAGCAVRPR